jgi:predicted transposase YbfD/YdcC
MPCTPKKTFDLILLLGCHFLAQVKVNCRKLWGQIALYTALCQPISTCEYYEEAHGHQIYRRVELFVNQADLPNGWNGIERLVKVRRWGTRNRVPFEERAFYVLSKPINSAALAARAIQEHWGIENKLHWVKDVNMGEDDMTLRDANSVAVLVYLNNAALNLLRMTGQKPTKDTFAKITNKVNELHKLFQNNKKN